MKLFEVLDEICECECEMVFEGARSPSKEERAYAVRALAKKDPSAKLASIGVYSGTGDIHIETQDGKEYIIPEGSGKIQPITEAAIRQFKRVGGEIKKRYRCLSGPKAGKLVATPNACATRKQPKKVRQGRKVMRAKKGVIKRKSAISKRKQISRMVTRMNRRLAGKL